MTEQGGDDSVAFVAQEATRSLVEDLASEVGEEWLAAQLSEGEDETWAHRHPLAQDLALATRQLAANDGSAFKSQTVVRMARLSYDLAMLRRVGVPGTDKRARGLTSGGEDQYRSTVHELQTAAGYLSRGMKVEFIEEEDGQRSADILLNAEVEVECKHKSPQTPRDRQRGSLYELLARGVSRLVDEAEGPNGVTVEVVFRGEPVREVIDEVLGQAKVALAPTGPYQMTGNGQRCRYRIRSVRARHAGSSGVVLEFPNPEAYDAGWVSADVQMLEGGPGAVHNAASVAVTCDVEDDKSRGIRTSLKKAAGQFSGERPTIIQLDLTSLTRKLMRDNFTRGRAVIDEVLRNNTSISAVVVATDDFNQESDELESVTSLIMFENPGARRPLPQAYRRMFDASGTADRPPPED